MLQIQLRYWYTGYEFAVVFCCFASLIHLKNSKQSLGHFDMRAKDYCL